MNLLLWLPHAFSNSSRLVFPASTPLNCVGLIATRGIARSGSRRGPGIAGSGATVTSATGSACASSGVSVDVGFAPIVFFFFAAERVATLLGRHLIEICTASLTVSARCRAAERHGATALPARENKADADGKPATPADPSTVHSMFLLNVRKSAPIPRFDDVPCNPDVWSSRPHDRPLNRLPTADRRRMVSMTIFLRDLRRRSAMSRRHPNSSPHQQLWIQVSPSSMRERCYAGRPMG